MGRSKLFFRVGNLLLNLRVLLLGDAGVIRGGGESASGEQGQSDLDHKHVPVMLIVSLGIVSAFFNGYGLFQSHRWWGACLFFFGWFGFGFSVFLFLYSLR
jgi:hypothetical protein